MDNLIDINFAKISAISKREFLFFIVNNSPETIIQINTLSNRNYNALVVNIGITKEDGTNVTFKLYDTNNRPTENYIHINLNHIESLQIYNQDHAINILSLGTWSNNTSYTETSKLEVQRCFLEFPKNILNLTTINVGELQMDLPENKLALNRVLKTTHVIQKAIEVLLLEDDAKQSWKQKYNSIQFIDSDSFDIKAEARKVIICFHFTNLTAKEIEQQLVINKLMVIL